MIEKLIPIIRRRASPLAPLGTIAAMLFLGSCSSTLTAELGSAPESEGVLAAQSSTTSSPSPENLRLGVYLARGSLFGSPEFEQYRVSGSSLYVECGIIRGGRAVARAQDLLRLSPGAKEVLQTLGQDLSSYVEKEKPSLAAPESGSLGFMHPGEATLQFTQGTLHLKESGLAELKTTVDEVSSASNSSPVRKLVVGLRTIARESLKSKGGSEEPLCGNTSFYGIE
jgi:hypothetical protein